MDELAFDGKKFISSRRASELTGYAKDYVGQLCRMGKVTARQVGRVWYVEEESLLSHRGTPIETTLIEAVPEVTEPLVPTAEAAFDEGVVPIAQKELAEEVVSEDFSDTREIISSYVRENTDSGEDEKISEESASFLPSLKRSSQGVDVDIRVPLKISPRAEILENLSADRSASRSGLPLYVKMATILLVSLVLFCTNALVARVDTIRSKKPVSARYIILPPKNEIGALFARFSKSTPGANEKN